MPKKPDTWMPLYIGDYLKDTMHLGAAEHGSYLLLIMHYWQKGPIPDDDAQLKNLTKNTAHIWKKIRPVIEKFFEVRDGHWHHNRIDEEIAKAAENKDVRRRKAEAAASARWAKRDAPSMSQAMPQNAPSPSPSPSPSSSLRSEESDSANDLFGGEAKPNGKQPPAKRQAMPVAMAAEFDAWWAEYPKKVGKGDARKAYLKARKVVGPGELLDGLRRAARYWRDQGTEARFIPNPATWLNGERWNDDCAAAGQSRNLNPYQI